MPIYLYENENTGKRIELMQRIGEAVAPEGYFRIFVAAIPSCISDGVLKHKEIEKRLAPYKNYERRHGTSDFERKVRKVSEIKSAIKKQAEKEQKITTQQ